MSTAFNTRLSDREAIRDCLFLYCRGIDRADEQSLRRAYWPDAQDNHGPYCGDAEGFIAWAMAALKSFERSIHTLSNILIDFQEHGAHVESYFTARQRLVADGERQQLLMIGRYIDWFEPRDGEWRILRCTVVYDWVEEQTPPERAETDRFGLRQPVGRPWPDDIVYRSLQDG